MTSQRKEFSELRKRIGQRIRKARLHKNLSLVQLSNKTRLNPKTLDYLEMGRGKFHPHFILRVAIALDVPFSTFLRPG